MNSIVLWNIVCTIIVAVWCLVLTSWVARIERVMHELLQHLEDKERGKP